MDTFFAIVSFPFWFLGIFLIVASIIGKITVNGVVTNSASIRITVFICGAVFTLVAFLMVWGV